MSMIYVLIPLALMLLAVAVWAMIWAIRSGQFDDLDAQAWSVVLDDDEKPLQGTDDSAGGEGNKEGSAGPEGGAK